MKNTILMLIAICCISPAIAQTYFVTTVAGNHSDGYSGDGGPATNAQIGFVRHMARDPAGNIYICDQANKVIRKIDASGIITTIAGTGTNGYSGDGGPATAAQIYDPQQIAADGAGNVYIAEEGSHIVRKVSASGIISTIAGTPGVAGFSGDGGPATAAQLNVPLGLAVDGSGNVYIGDAYNMRIRKIDVSGTITTIAGNGTPDYVEGVPATTSGLLYSIQAVAADDAGNVYVAEDGHTVKKISAGGIITTFAGGGGSGYVPGMPATSLWLSEIVGIAADGIGNVYMTDMTRGFTFKVDTNGNIRIISGNLATTFGYSGDNGPAIWAEFNYVCCVATGDSGSVYVGDGHNYVVRKVYPDNYIPEFGDDGSSSVYSVCKNSATENIDYYFFARDLDTEDTLTWSVAQAPAHGTLTASYTALSTGDYVFPSGITYTPAPGYSGQDTLKVQVSDGKEIDTTTMYITILPSSETITGTQAICSGSTTTLATTATGGTWQSSNPAVALVNETTGVVTGIASGTAMIKYVVSSGCTPDVTMTVALFPPSIAGDPVVCVGQNNPLSNAVSGGTWSSSSTSIVYVYPTTGVILGMSAGTATISYRLTGGCKNTMQVTVNAIPSAIAGTTTVCIAATTTLTHTETGGTWSSSNTARATVDAATGVVTGISYGTCTITYRVGPGCYRTTTVMVNLLPGAITGTQLLCAGSTVTLGSGSTGGTWSSGDGAVATVSTTGVVTGVSEGTVNISYTNANGCFRTATMTINAAVPANTGTPEVCVGFTTALSNTASGGTWSSSSIYKATVSTTGLVTSVAPGTANISYTMSAGCRSITQVTVNASVPTITGATGVCINASTTYSNTATGGIWSSSNTSLGTIDPSTGVLSGIAAGTLSITYTLPTGCFKTKAVTVNVLPGTIMGTTTVCVAATTTLSGSPGYSWTSGNTGIATVTTSGIVTGVAAGTADITFHTTAGCKTATVVTVQPLPDAITGTFTVCQGATTTLSSAGTPGGTWASNNTARATVDATSGVVTGVGSGTLTITYTWTNTCKRTAAMTANAIPAASSITGTGSMSVAATQTLIASQPGGAWISADPSRATIDASSGLMTGISAGTVTITDQRTNDCGTRTNIRTFTITAAKPSVQVGGTTATFSVYPNPTRGALTLETPIAGMFTLYTIDGKVVGNYPIEQTTTAITLSQGLTAGIYIGRFNGSDGTTATVRLVYEP